MSWHELLAGIVVLGIPQAPLTLGNAVIGTTAENNQHFPDRPVTAKAISIDHGVMNLAGVFLGGVPMCHGAGGMAGHIRFGARTGGALVILGVILFIAGVELALVIKDVRLKRDNLFVLLVTGGIAMWNMGVAYLAGLLLYYALNRRWIRV